MKFQKKLMQSSESDRIIFRELSIILNSNDSTMQEIEFPNIEILSSRCKCTMKIEKLSMIRIIRSRTVLLDSHKTSNCFGQNSNVFSNFRTINFLFQNRKQSNYPFIGPNHTHANSICPTISIVKV